MSQKDKKIKKKEKILEVVEAFQQDVGYKRVRIDLETRTELDLNTGDTAELEGTKKTLAIVWRAHPSDEDKKTVRIDKYTRKKVGADIGQKVTIRKAKKRLSVDEQMKRDTFSSYDNRIVVAKADKTLMKELEEGLEILDHKRERIDELLTTMSRLEKEVSTVHNAIWKSLHENLELKDNNDYSYNRQTGEVTTCGDGC